MKTITVEVSDAVYELLQVLTHAYDINYDGGPTGAATLTVDQVVAELVDHAQQGVYRPGAWERGWLQQAFGDAWEQYFAPDTRPSRLAGDGRVIFQRPRTSPRPQRTRDVLYPRRAE